MYVAVKGTDNGIYWCEVNPNPTSPSQGPWRKLTGKTLSGPSIDMASFTLYVAVRGMDNGIYFTSIDTYGCRCPYAEEHLIVPVWVDEQGGVEGMLPSILIQLAHDPVWMSNVLW